MKYIKQYFIAEAKRYYNEHNRSPRMLDWKGKDDYPNYWDVRDEFGYWTDFLREAGLPLNTNVAPKHIICEICGKKYRTTRANRKICDSKKCRYIRDSLYHVEKLKESYVCSIFHYIPKDKLVEYFSCLYDIRKKNLPTMKVI